MAGCALGALRGCRAQRPRAAVLRQLHGAPLTVRAPPARRGHAAQHGLLCVRAQPAGAVGRSSGLGARRPATSPRPVPSRRPRAPPASAVTYAYDLFSISLMTRLNGARARGLRPARPSEPAPAPPAVTRRPRRRPLWRARWLHGLDNAPGRALARSECAPGERVPTQPAHRFRGYLVRRPACRPPPGLRAARHGFAATFRGAGWRDSRSLDLAPLTRPLAPTAPWFAHRPWFSSPSDTLRVSFSVDRE